MTDVSFYHLQRQPLDVALPKLLEKVTGAGLKAVVRAADDARLEALDTALWTYNPDSFLAHGTAKLGHSDLQPIYLTNGDENPAGATVLVLTDGAEPGDVSAYDRCLIMFDGRDEQAVAAARALWKDFGAADHTVTYWQQTDRGGWEKKA